MLSVFGRFFALYPHLIVDNEEISILAQLVRITILKSNLNLPTLLI